MTRDQDFERDLADWLEAGPVTAPSEVVEEAVARTHRRRQRSPWWSWLRAHAGRLRGSGEVRRMGLPVVIVLTLLAALAVTLPLAGGPGPAPEMDPSAIRVVEGNVELISATETANGSERVLHVSTDDPRVEGKARQVLTVEDASEAGLGRSAGVMRLTNDWGAWEGAVNGARYPDGTEIEYGWLAGEGAYAGFSYFHSTRDHPAEAERVFEGAIWPGEPPPMPDPSLIQADPLG